MRVILAEYQGTPILDIRNYYEKNGEMAPTKKGISLSRNKFLDLAKVIEDKKDEISTFLENKKNLDQFSEYKEKKINALEDLKTVESANLNLRPVTGRSICSIEYQGAKATVTLDPTHKFIEKYSSSPEVQELLMKVFLAIDISTRLVSEDEVPAVQQSFDRFDYELTRQLKNLAEV